MDFGDGPMNTNPASWHAWAKSRVLAEKSVAGMDGVDLVTARGVEYPLDVQVALGGRRGADMRGFIGLADMQRRAVRIRINGNRTNTHFAESADNAKRDFAAVGDQDTGEH